MAYLEVRNRTDETFAKVAWGEEIPVDANSSATVVIHDMKELEHLE